MGCEVKGWDVRGVGHLKGQVGRMGTERGGGQSCQGAGGRMHRAQETESQEAGPMTASVVVLQEGTWPPLR